MFLIVHVFAQQAVCDGTALNIFWTPIETTQANTSKLSVDITVGSLC